MPGATWNKDSCLSNTVIYLKLDYSSLGNRPNIGRTARPGLDGPHGLARWGRAFDASVAHGTSPEPFTKPCDDRSSPDTSMAVSLTSRSRLDASDESPFDKRRLALSQGLDPGQVDGPYMSRCLAGMFFCAAAGLGGLAGTEWNRSRESISHRKRYGLQLSYPRAKA